MIPSSNHSFASKSTATTTLVADHQLSSEIFVSDVFYQEEELENQQLTNQLRGMIRREFGRKLFEWKKNKTSSSNRVIIDGNDIDRVFGATTAVSNRRKSNKEKASIAANSNSMTINNHHRNEIVDNSNSNNETTEKSKWHTIMSATPNIFSKKAQEKNLESYILV